MTSSDATRSSEQYSLAQILGIWVAVAAPMGLLAWVVFPALKGNVSMNPGIFLWVLMIIGLMWQVVLSLAILYRETGTLNLGAIRHRTWRQRPRDPKTGQPRGRLWLWLIPAILLGAAVVMVVSQPLDGAWTSIFPFFAEPPGYSLESLMDTPEQWVGAWYLLVLWVFQFVGNYLWGEEFLHNRHHLHLPQQAIPQCLVRPDCAWVGRRVLLGHHAGTRVGAGIGGGAGPGQGS
jgi:hypothetical protein